MSVETPPALPPIGARVRYLGSSLPVGLNEKIYNSGFQLPVGSEGTVKEHTLGYIQVDFDKDDQFPVRTLAPGEYEVIG